MTDKPPQALKHVFREAYRSALNSYGDIEVGFDQFANKLETIAQNEHGEDFDESFLRGLVKKLHTNDVYLTIGCALPTETAWRTFTEYFKPIIHGVAFYATGDSERAWELTVDVLTHLYMPGRYGLSRIASFDGRWSLSTWLRTVVVNRVINENHSRWSKALPLDSVENLIDEGQPERLDAAVRASTYGSVVCDALIEACRALEDSEALMLLLRYDEGLNGIEIGRLLHVHPSNVTRRLQQTRDHVRRDVVSILTNRYQLNPAAVELCIAEIVENPSYSIVSYLKQAHSQQRNQISSLPPLGAAPSEPRRPRKKPAAGYA
jgi:RNA polymerase sigma factor (sigma-70 family)